MRTYLPGSAHNPKTTFSHPVKCWLMLCQSLKPDIQFFEHYNGCRSSNGDSSDTRKRITSQFIWTNKLVSFFLTHLQFCAASIKFTSECWHLNKRRKNTYCCHEQFSRADGCRSTSNCVCVYLIKHCSQRKYTHTGSEQISVKLFKLRTT